MTTTIGQWVMGRWARWQLPVLVLLGLLQRAPVWQVAAGIGPRLVGPTVAVVRSAFTLAAMGTYQTLAGATQLAASPASPLQSKVGETLEAGFAVTGAPASAGSYEVRGALPPGVTIAGLQGDLVNASAVALTGTPTAAGTYELQIRAWQGLNKGGLGGSPTFTYRIVVAAADVTPPPPPPTPALPPTIQAQPASATVAPGGSVTFNVGATGASGAGVLTYQWRRNGVVIGGATAASLTLSALTAAANADYTVAVTNTNGTTVSAPATLLVATPQPGRLINLAVRSRAGSGAPLIVGFVVTGAEKSFLLRGVGPSLGAFGVTGVLADPLLELHQDVNGVDTIPASNDNWAQGGVAVLTEAFGRVGAFGFSGADSLDAALIAAVSGQRTAHIVAPAGTAGEALVELYDLGEGNASRLINVSARNRVVGDSELLTAGFVINGNVPKRLLIRGIGPRLAEFGVAGALGDPRLRIFRGDEVVAENDNWGGSAELAAAFAATGAFGLPDMASNDAALIVTLPPVNGGYTAQISGAPGTAGEALVEVYELP